MFSKKNKKSKKIESKEELKPIIIHKKENPLDKIPNEILAKAIKDIMNKGNS